MDEARVRLLLELEAATEAPPSRVDVERARSEGRRKLRRQRASLAGGAVMVVVAVLIAALATSGPLATVLGRGQAPAASGQVTPPSVFSPLRPYAAFGWLPSGATLNGGTLSPTNDYLTAGPRVAWALTAYVAGFCNLSSEQVLRQLGEQQQPQLSCSDSGGGTVYQVASTGPEVDGHTAFWADSDRYLVWQYGPGSWAALAPARGAATSVVIKVADSVSYGVAGSPVRFPVQLTGMPAASQLAYVDFAADGGVLRASQIDLTAASADVPPPALTVGPASAGSSCPSSGQSVSRRINGYQVAVSNLSGSASGNPAMQQVCAPSADGLTVIVSTYGDESPDAVSMFSSHMRLLGANPASWTTQPLS